MRKKRKFYTCYNCKFKTLCAVSVPRLEGVCPNSPIIDDIGCFEYEIYDQQSRAKQLDLFQ